MTDPIGTAQERELINYLCRSTASVEEEQAADALLSLRVEVERLREALLFAEPVLAEELDCLLNSYTNLGGPHIGKVTDPDGKRYVAQYRKSLALIRAALSQHGKL